MLTEHEQVQAKVREQVRQQAETERQFARVGIIATLVGIGTAALMAVGIWQQWFGLSLTGNSATVTVHQERIGEDIREVGEEATKLVDTVSSAVQLENAEGQVQSVTDQQLTIVSGEKPGKTLHFDLHDAEIRTAAGQPGGTLNVGDKVTVVYRTRDNRQVAEKVTVVTAANE